ncbi:hypothetical protein SDC9_118231 [bioreactor metagenome]|uniref:Uncharacterized protein n=1 Tax=bioreactor metagenome TaxID=1076179 RepID=A0A645C206_9ZZZZ
MDLGKIVGLHKFAKAGLDALHDAKHRALTRVAQCHGAVVKVRGKGGFQRAVRHVQRVRCRRARKHGKIVHQQLYPARGTGFAPYGAGDRHITAVLQLRQAFAAYAVVVNCLQQIPAGAQNHKCNTAKFA